jgi:hypothetical protein
MMNMVVVQNTSNRNIKSGIKRNHHKMYSDKKYFFILKKKILTKSQTFPYQKDM